ncbi:MAG: ribonuclease H-like domain-containing protein, partial [Clostridium celatum]|nr:ribonuclease H-like domain-containing protein [Clostridium celatum]
EGDVISGSNLAKTFHKVLKDREYIERMPKEKIETILLYNEQDVVNLYKIFITWKDYIKSKDEEIKINIDEEDIEIDKEEINANRFIQEDKEEIEATEVEKVQDCIVD